MAEKNATPLQFVDSNILVYAYDLGNDKKHDQAVDLLESLWESKLGCLSIQVLQEFYVNVRRKTDSPISSEQAAQVIHDLSEWTVHRPGVRDIISAIELHQRHQLSFWDAMILRSAQEGNCAILWSEDFSDGRDYGGVKIRNPFKD